MAPYKWQSVSAPARTEDWIALMNRAYPSREWLSVTSSLVPKPKSSLGPRTGQSAHDPKYNVHVYAMYVYYKCMCAVQYAKKASVTIVCSLSSYQLDLTNLELIIHV